MKIPEDTLEDFKLCTAANPSVVSEVFCLPSDYRKDVPPPSEFSGPFLLERFSAKWNFCINQMPNKVIQPAKKKHM